MTQFLSVSETAALQTRYTSVLERLHHAARQAGRNPTDICLVSISKGHTADMLAALHSICASSSHPLVIGENYMQEALDKQERLAALCPLAAPQWHFTGHLQSRKAKDLVGRFSLLHTLDSVKLARNLQGVLQKPRQNATGFLGTEGAGGAAGMETAARLTRQTVLLQVNIGREPQKAGVLPEALPALAEAVQHMPELDIQGLMCIPPMDGTVEETRPYFAALRELRDRLSYSTGLDLPQLSMGMSQDFDAAIAEGATIVRVGSDIFGPRTVKAA